MIKKKVDIKSLIYNYVSKGIHNSEALSILQTRIIYLLALKDFFNGKISEKEIQAIAWDLSFVFQKTQTDIWLADSDLGRALEDACDLVYYWEKRKKNARDNINYETRYKGMKDYYEDNKSLLKNLKQ